MNWPNSSRVSQPWKDGCRTITDSFTMPCQHNAMLHGGILPINFSWSRPRPTWKFRASRKTLIWQAKQRLPLFCHCTAFKRRLWWVIWSLLNTFYQIEIWVTPNSDRIFKNITSNEEHVCSATLHLHGVVRQSIEKHAFNQERPRWLEDKRKAQWSDDTSSSQCKDMTSRTGDLSLKIHDSLNLIFLLG